MKSLFGIVICACGGLLRGEDMPAAAADRDTIWPFAAPRAFRDKVQPHWFASDVKFWYRVTVSRDEHEFILVDAEKGTRQPAFDHPRLAKALNAAGLNDTKATQLQLDGLEFESSGQAVTFRAGGKGWHCDLTSYELREQSVSNSPPAARSL